jgi:hypothetical protein
MFVKKLGACTEKSKQPTEKCPTFQADSQWEQLGDMIPQWLQVTVA